MELPLNKNVKKKTIMQEIKKNYNKWTTEVDPAVVVRHLCTIFIYPKKTNEYSELMCHISLKQLIMITYEQSEVCQFRFGLCSKLLYFSWHPLESAGCQVTFTITKGRHFYNLLFFFIVAIWVSYMFVFEFWSVILS